MISILVVAWTCPSSVTYRRPGDTLKTPGGPRANAKAIVRGHRSQPVSEYAAPIAARLAVITAATRAGFGRMTASVDKLPMIG
jgi:hypothetical protein